MEIATAISAFAGLGITAAQIYTKLSTLAYQIRFARDQILRIAQDVSGVETAIQQLTELLKDEEISKSVDSDNKSLRLIQNLRISCQRLLEEIDKGLKEASKQIKGKGLSPGVEVTLSPAEQALWPFHRDKVDPMLRDLDAMRSTLILVSQMTTLSLVKRLAVGARPKSRVTKVDEDDKELLYRAIYASLQDPQIQRMFSSMIAQSTKPDGKSDEIVPGQTASLPVSSLPSTDYATEQPVPLLPKTYTGFPPVTKARSIVTVNDHNKSTPEGQGCRDDSFSIEQNEAIIDRFPPGSKRENSQDEEDLEKPKAEDPFDVPRDRCYNTLLRIMQQRPSRIPNEPGNESLGGIQCGQSTRSRTANAFRRKAQSVFWGFVGGFRKHKDISMVVPHATRRAYLFIPQVNQDLEGSSVTYKIKELLISQSQIAYALSYWSARRSGSQQFNSSEPSQRQALDQIERERGKLFPSHFFIASIQYTKPRIFSTTAAFLRACDTVVVVEEFKDGRESFYSAPGKLRKRANPLSTMDPPNLEVMGMGSDGLQVLAESPAISADPEQRSFPPPAILAGTPRQSPEQVVDQAIREFGIPLLLS